MKDDAWSRIDCKSLTSTKEEHSETGTTSGQDPKEIVVRERCERAKMWNIKWSAQFDEECGLTACVCVCENSDKNR